MAQVMKGICLDFSEIAAIKNEWMRQWAQTVLVGFFFAVTDFFWMISTLLCNISLLSGWALGN